MNDYIISCCSTVDLTKEYLEKIDVKYVCFNFELDGVQHKDDLYQSMTADELYTAMVNGADTKTSQVSIGEYIDHFKKYLDEGKDIFHVTLSSGISGTYNSAMLAQAELQDEYPDRKIIIIDSLAASAGYGLLVNEIATQRDKGLTIDELSKWTEENKLYVNHWFFSSDLTFFIKGGRVSKTAGLIGGVLNICPLLNVSNEGKLIPREKIRTKKKAIKTSFEKMCTLANNKNDYNGKCFISHSACYDDAKALADLIENNFPKLDGKVQITDIGATIGSHTGPGTVALFFWGDKRVD